jgi:hypothetical protein
MFLFPTAKPFCAASSPFVAAMHDLQRQKAPAGALPLMLRPLELIYSTGGRRRTENFIVNLTFSSFEREGWPCPEGLRGARKRNGNDA